MRVCCLIDSLGSGGAQRQMTWLVRLLKDAGHDVRLVTYFRQYEHFLPDVLEAGVEPEQVDSRSKAGRLWKVRRRIRSMRPDCIISFLNTPNLMAVASSIGFRRLPVIVSERTLDIHGKTFGNRFRFNVFRLAGRIVTNSFAQAEFIRVQFPFLERKTRTILNCVDLQKFAPAGEDRKQEAARKLIVGASVNPSKNVLRFVEALGLAMKRLPAGSLTIDWYGNNFFRNGSPAAGSKYYLEAIELRDRLGLEEVLRFAGEIQDIHLRFREYDGACLPSTFEGCPNFICEAMACGLPVVASHVSDLKMIVGEGEADCCGRLFDPMSTSAIADALVEFATCDREENLKKGRAARSRAERLFAPATLAENYTALVHEVVG